MFILEKEQEPSMGLTKHIVDYVTLSKDGRQYSSKAERFKHNTSGRNSGGKEMVMSVIRKRLNMTNTGKRIGMNEEEIYMRLLEKLEEGGSDFNVDRMNISNIDVFAKENIKWTFDTIFQEIKRKSEEEEKEVEFVTAEDRSGDEETKNTTDEKLFKLGLIDDSVEDNAVFTEEDAKHLLVQSLDNLKMYADTIFTQGDKKVNALKPLQHIFAYNRFYEEQEYLESLHKDAMKDGRVSRITNKKDMAASLGLQYNTYFKQTLRLALIEDYQTKGRPLFNIYNNIIKACEKLNIDIVWIDADEVMDDGYIRRLKHALYQEKTVCVSEYDLEELDLDINSTDLKIDYVRGELIKSGIPKDKIPRFFNQDVMDRIHRVKTSEFRKLGTIISDIQYSYNSYSENNKFAKMNKGDKNFKEIQRNTPEYLDRMRYVHTTLLHGYSEKRKDGQSFIPGPFSDECLAIIKKVTDEFFMNLMIEDPERAWKLHNLGISIIEKGQGKLSTDGNGFVYYTDNSWYAFMEEEKPFHIVDSDNNKLKMNKWLINTRGFYVNKFVDALVREGKELEPHSACKKGQFDMLIIKTFDGEVIPID